MWQAETVQDKRELLTLVGACATSQYVATEAINAGGVSYVVGEMITLPHAGGFALATFEVLTESAGVVTSLVRRNWGAYADRIATSTINVGGASYAVDDILEVQNGAGTQMGKVIVDTEAAGVITAVSPFETGGAYSSTPAATGEATLGIGPIGFAGDDAATVDLTFTGLIGTTGLATTSDLSGTGLTLDITLAQAGHSTGSFNSMRDTNDFSIEGSARDKQLALRGTVTGGDEPFTMYRTGQDTVGLDVNQFICISASTAFNPATDFNAQAGLVSDIDCVGSGRYTAMFDAQDHLVWISVSPRAVRYSVKTIGQVVTAYQFGYNGLGDQFETDVINSYPVVCGGSTTLSTTLPDSTTAGVVTGPVEAYEASGSAPPWTIRRFDGTLAGVRNSDPFGTRQRNRGMYPCMETFNVTSQGGFIVDDGAVTFFNVIRPEGSTANLLILPAPDSGGDLFTPIPAVMLETPTETEPLEPEDSIRMEMSNMFWTTGIDGDGNDVLPEDTITDQNGLRYRVFRSGSRTEPYSLWCMGEE